MGFYNFYGFRPYVSAAERRRKAERELQKLRQKGHVLSPVVLDGRAITRTFWGEAWCLNLERYSDFSNRLPRGRSYVRNRAVVDLQIAPGKVTALVSGTEVYRVAIKVSAVPRGRWKSICTDCAGAIDSLVELLQGRFSTSVMKRICQQRTGLFPAPSEIQFSCSCPDWASMCKHVAAVLYGIGARLDQQPELLFTLRQVDEQDLVAKAGKGLPMSKRGPSRTKVLAAHRLSELFGLELGTSIEEPTREAMPAPKKARQARQAKRRASKRRSASAAGAAPATTAKRQSSRTASKQPPKPKARPERGARTGKATKQRPRSGF